MNSSVTLLSASSVISSFCLPINCSSRSNGPVKFIRLTWNPVGPAVASAAAASGTAASVGVTPATLLTPPSPSRRHALREHARLPLGCVLGDDLAGQLTVGLGPGRTRVQRRDRRTGHGRLGELHRLGDHGLVDLVAERLD